LAEQFLSNNTSLSRPCDFTHPEQSQQLRSGALPHDEISGRCPGCFSGAALEHA
jgi:hypothetical protein